MNKHFSYVGSFIITLVAEILKKIKYLAL